MTYFFSHHVQEDFKHLVAYGNHTLHHACREYIKINAYNRQHSGFIKFCVISLLLTRFIFLDRSVFKVSKHDLKAVGVESSQHPERRRGNIINDQF